MHILSGDSHVVAAAVMCQRVLGFRSPVSRCFTFSAVRHRISTRGVRRVHRAVFTSRCVRHFFCVSSQLLCCFVWMTMPKVAVLERTDSRYGYSDIRPSGLDTPNRHLICISKSTRDLKKRELKMPDGGCTVLQSSSSKSSLRARSSFTPSPLPLPPSPRTYVNSNTTY